MSPWTSSPCSVMLYGFTDRGCLRRRILITCMTSWTSPFSRSLNRSPMTPSDTYSTRPSREDRGLSSFTSAVKMHVASVDLSCLQRANSFSRRSLSSANSMFNKLIESIATREAPLRLMKSGSSDRIRVTVVFCVRGLQLHDVEFLLLDVRGQVPSEGRRVRDDGVGVLFEGDEDGLLSVDQTLHQELQGERRLPGPEGTEDRDDVPRRHAATEHLIEAIDAREHESARMFAGPRVHRGVRCFRFGDCPTSGNPFHVYDDETVI